MKLKEKIGIIGISAVMLLLAGCGKQKASQNEKDELNWSVSSQISSLDASKAADTESFATLINVGEGIYRIDKSGTPKLALAKKYTVSKDKKHYDFYLKKTKWANGEALTAKDFVTTYQRTINPKTKSQSAGLFTLFKNGKAIVQGKKPVSSLGVSAPSKYHLHFDLENPSPILNEYLSLPLLFPQNSREIEKAGNKYGTSSKYFISNGPYKIGKWDPNQKSWTLIKNKNYWDAKNVHLKKINMQSNESTVTNYNLYQAGKVANTFLDSSQMQANSKKKNFHTFSTYGLTRMDFNFKANPVFNNLKIRQALSAAINRDELLKTIHSKNTPALGLVPEDFIKNPKTGTSFAKDAYVKDSVTYNLQRAKKLWQEGKKEENINKLELTILSSDNTEDEEAAEYIQSNLSELPGLTIKVRHVPATQQLALVSAGGKNYDLNIMSMSQQVPSIYDALNLFSNKSVQNPGWSNKKYNQILKNANGKNATNTNAQYQDFVKAEKLLMEQQATIPLYENNVSLLIKPNVKDYIFMPNYFDFDMKSVRVEK